jgi:glycosyltransferase involved in cell wall biosynthesis
VGSHNKKPLYYKGIEHAIELVKELNDPRYKLLISHEAGDEGYEYAKWLKEDDQKNGADLRYISTGVRDPFNESFDPKNRHSLWDIYPYADFITYPSLYEGFGNVVHAGMAGKTKLLNVRWNSHFVHVPMESSAGKRKKANPGSELWTAVLAATGQVTLKTS